MSSKPLKIKSHPSLIVTNKGHLCISTAAIMHRAQTEHSRACLARARAVEHV